MPARIKTGDDVIVIGGKDRGKRGKVLRVDPQKERVYVEGLNMIKRHQRPNPAGGVNAAGGVIEKEGPIHLSNVAIADPEDGRPTRVGVEIAEGRRYRIAKRSGTRID